MNKITEEIGSGKPGPGRPKGALNKTTRLFKEAIESVYADLQEGSGGGNSHFLIWASDNPTEFYKLASKLLPVQVSGEDGGAITVVINKP